MGFDKEYVIQRINILELKKESLYIAIKEVIDGDKAIDEILDYAETIKACNHEITWLENLHVY